MFICRVVGGELHPGPETIDAAFFSLDALPEPILPYYVLRIRHAARSKDVSVHFE